MRMVHALAVLSAAGLCAGAHAVQVGYVHNFSAANDFGGFLGGTSAGTLYENFGVNGVDGPNDGFLTITNVNLGHFGGYTQLPEFQGDWIGAGVTRLTFWMKDVGAFNNFEMHVALGYSNQNIWQYNAPFVPTGEWQRFTVEIGNLNPADWTRIRGSGTLLDALSDVDRILFRHDRPPYTPTPNPIIGDLGLDKIRIVPAPGGAALLSVCAVGMARRRR